MAAALVPRKDAVSHVRYLIADPEDPDRKRLIELITSDPIGISTNSITDEDTVEGLRELARAHTRVVAPGTLRASPSVVV